MMINLKDVRCIQIGNVMLGIENIETKIGNVKLIAVE